MRRGLHILLIMLFAVRALVPVGFMLQASASDGGMTIVICTASGPQTLAANSEHSPLQDDSDGDTNGMCPFANMPAAVHADNAVPSLAVQVRYAAVVYRLTIDLYRATPKPHDLSARGLPTLA